MSLTETIRAAEARRCSAMLANDAAEFEAVLDPQLYFAHANGGVDDKAAYLTKMAGGRIVYIGITWSEEVVTPLAENVAMLTGRMKTDVQVDGVEKSLSNRVISVWGHSGDDWRLIAFQSTPLATQ
jgi:methylaspartate ammonia-lyase